MRYLEIKIKPIFNVEILILEIDNHKISSIKHFLNEEEFKIFENKEKLQDFFKNSNVHGISLFGYSKIYDAIIIFKKNKESIKESTNTLFHELDHVKQDILETRNIKDTEMHAWLMGWLASEVIHSNWKKMMS